MNNMMRKCLAGALGVALAVGGGIAITHVEAGPPREKLNQAIKASVYIISIDDNSKPLARGSGTVLDSKGLILTNFHVVGNEKGDALCNKEGIVAILVTKDPRQSAVPMYLGKVKDFDKDLDLAVVEIVADIQGNRLQQPPTMDFITPGNSDDLQIGEEMTIIGYPGLGFDSVTLSTGRVSGFLPFENDPKKVQLIKTDAEINPGNSGGTAINDEGLLIGVPTFTHEGLKDQRYGKIGLIRPVNLAADLLSNKAGTGGNQRNTPPRRTGPEQGPLARQGSVTFAGWALHEDATSFINEAQSGISQLYGYIDYTRMSKNTRFRAQWYYNGQVIDGTQIDLPEWPWNSTDARASLYISSQGVLPDGTYSLEVIPGTADPVRAEIKVGGGRQAQPPVQNNPQQNNPQQQDPQQGNPFFRPPSQQQQQTVKLTGKVVSADTGRPIPGAYLLVLVPGKTFQTANLNDPSHFHDLVQTNRSGMFESNKGLLLDENYSVAILADGYEPVGGDGFVPRNFYTSGAFIDMGQVQLKAK